MSKNIMQLITVYLFPMLNKIKLIMLSRQSNLKLRNIYIFQDVSKPILEFSILSNLLIVYIFIEFYVQTNRKYYHKQSLLN